MYIYNTSVINCVDAAARSYRQEALSRFIIETRNVEVRYGVQASNPEIRYVVIFE